MSSSQSEHNLKRRTSQRRRIKMLKKANQFKILNPYKYNREEYSIPEELYKQLRQIDYLCSTSIAMLNFQKENTPAPISQNLLEKMNLAFRQQQQKYLSLYGNSQMPQEMNYQSLQSLNISQGNKKQQAMAQQVITTKEQISLNLYEPNYLIHENIFQYHNNELQVQNSHNIFNDQSIINDKPMELIPVDEEYENYFIN